MDTFTVYKITCLINNKLYIGYTKNDINYRLKQHFKKASQITNKNNKMSNAILKYGRINFKIEKLFQSLNKEEALFKEIYYISYYNTVKEGYNTTNGGEGGGKKGWVMTDEHKEKLRIANTNKIVTDETKKLISENHADVSGDKNPFFNKKHSDETKLKIADRVYIKGVNHHFYGKQMITSFKEGKEHPRSQQIIINGIEYGSLRLAAKALNMTRQKLKKLYLNQ